ncbi:MAG: GIY-YIG nuclease family protein [Candidatus Bathyarchaeota archaeon]|jgi:Uri superfamily endonuclease
MLPQTGVYTLILHLSTAIHVKVGKLGKQRFPKGYYAYTGSALGLGASSLRKRVARHLQKKKRKFWHIDYLLAHESVVAIAIVAFQTSRKIECKINRCLKDEMTAEIPVLGFGASDCKENCGSHLLFFPGIIEEEILIQKIRNVYDPKNSATSILRLQST